MSEPNRSSSAPHTICSTADVERNASGTPLIPLPIDWAGLPLNAYPILARSESGPACVSAPMLLMATRGYGRRWYRFGSRTLALSTAPGMIEL